MGLRARTNGEGEWKRGGRKGEKQTQRRDRQVDEWREGGGVGGGEGKEGVERKEECLRWVGPGK